MKDFARLERHDGLQVLAFVEGRTNDVGTYGPCLVIRCDPNISVLITSDPWPDTEAGWEATLNELEKADLAKFATEAKKFSKGLQQ